MDIETRITDVTVYLDRARVLRRGRARLDAGLHKLEIGELSNRLLPDSARLAAHGTAQARLLSMQVQQAFYAETPAEEIRRLEEQLEAAQDEIATQQGRIGLVQQAQAQLESLAGQTRVYARALASGKQTTDEQLVLFDRLRRRAAELAAEALTLEQSKRQAERRRLQFQQQLEQARSQRPLDRYTVTIDVEVTRPGDLTLELSYLVWGASWLPLYDLRLLEDGEKPALEVAYLAQVTQHSGEPWQEVALTLSTARPALAASIPELDPWYIQPRPALRPMPAPAASKMFMTARMEAPAGDDMQADMLLSAPESAPAEESVARVEAGGAAVSYGVPGRASVPPDGSAFKAVIARYPLPPELDYVSAPAVVPGAYRRVKAVNAGPYTLLPGKAGLFAGDEFLGLTHLELTAPQGEIEIYLGVDDRVRVERELMRRDMEKTIIGGKRRLHFGYEIKLENLLAVPAALLVRDRFPVGRHEEIKCRLESAEPRPAKVNELNQLEWNLSLAPGEKRSLRFDFVVEYPQDMDVLGLP